MKRKWQRVIQHVDACFGIRLHQKTTKQKSHKESYMSIITVGQIIINIILILFHFLE